MANYSMAAVKDDQVYYADIVEGVAGIYRISLQDFYDGKQGVCLVQNTDADNLTLSGDALIYRDISNERRNLCVYDLQSRKVRILKRNDTSHYYGSRNFVLFSLDSFGAGTSILTTDGKYETSINDLGCSDLYVYEGEIYVIIYEDTVYFKGSNGKGIYAASLKAPEEATKLSDNECAGMVVYENDLYYINSDDNYSLYRISLAEGKEELFDNSGYSCINIVGDSLYLLQPNMGYKRILLK